MPILGAPFLFILLGVDPVPPVPIPPPVAFLPAELIPVPLAVDRFGLPMPTPLLQPLLFSPPAPTADPPPLLPPPAPPSYRLLLQFVRERRPTFRIAGVVFVANQAEIATADLALRRTSSRCVQALAARIRTEHAQANQEMFALMQRLAAKLQQSVASDALSNQSGDDLSRLNEVDGQQFNET